MDQLFDLFGNPVRPGAGQKGRPSYVATEKDRNKIKMLLGLGWGNQRVADALDLSLATLKKYFKADLKIRHVMRDRLIARQFEIAMEQANAGNMTALKELDRLIDKNDRIYADRQIKQAQGDMTPKTKLGKKEREAIDAEKAADGTEWDDDLLFDGGRAN